MTIKMESREQNIHQKWQKKKQWNENLKFANLKSKWTASFVPESSKVNDKICWKIEQTKPSEFNEKSIEEINLKSENGKDEIR